MKDKETLFKILFWAFGVFTIYFFFTWFVLFFFETPRLFPRTELDRLYNWNIPAHAQGDYDQDGYIDLISFTGCAFLTATDTNKIPEDTKCVAEGISGLSPHFRDADAIGQKYADTNTYNLDLNHFAGNIRHAYVEKDHYGQWFIVVRTTNSFERFNIDYDGLLDKAPVTIWHKIDEALYKLSFSFNWLVVPTLPLFFIPLRPITYPYPFVHLGLLIAVTGVLYIVWKQNSKKR